MLIIIIGTTFVILYKEFSKADKYLFISKFSLMIGKFLFCNEKILSLNEEGKKCHEFLTVLQVPFSIVATTT